MYTGPGNASSISSTLQEVQRERIQLALMRSSFASVSLLCLVSVAWAIPWIPLGMTDQHYSTVTAAGLGLVAASCITSSLFFMAWGRKFRGESLPEFLQVLFGAKLLVRGRAQFYHRLKLECGRGRRRRRHVFSLIIIRLAAEGPGLPRQERNLITVLIRSIVRAGDILGDVGPNDLGLLVSETDQAGSQTILPRLAQRLVNSAALHACRIGSSFFPEDGDSPDELFAAAYERLTDAVTLIAEFPRGLAFDHEPRREGGLPDFLTRQLRAFEARAPVMLHEGGRRPAEAASERHERAA